MNVPHQFFQIYCFQLGLFNLVDYFCHCTGKLNDYNLRLEKHGHKKKKDPPHEQLLTALGLIKWTPCPVNPPENSTRGPASKRSLLISTMIFPPSSSNALSKSQGG